MAQIEKLAPLILKWEGGFVNDPDDLGGATKMGVTIGTWRQVGYDKTGDGIIDVSDLKLITKDEVINKVLKPHYWDRWRADEITDQSVANILVDWVWASGRHGIEIPQRILGVKPDGKVGPITLAALNAYNPKILHQKIWNARYNFIENICQTRPANRKFRGGWMNRLNDFKYTTQ
jgi:lysozyme family protein